MMVGSFEFRRQTQSADSLDIYVYLLFSENCVIFITSVVSSQYGYEAF